jgi:hypothetical protein
MHLSSRHRKVDRAVPLERPDLNDRARTSEPGKLPQAPGTRAMVPCESWTDGRPCAAKVGFVSQRQKEIGAIG